MLREVTVGAGPLHLPFPFYRTSLTLTTPVFIARRGK